MDKASEMASLELYLYGSSEAALKVYAFNAKAASSKMKKKGYLEEGSPASYYPMP